MRAHSRTLSGRRSGFVLLTVLWLMAGAGSLALGVTLLSWRVVEGVRIRRDYVAAYWTAQGCLAHARSIIDEQARRVSRPTPNEARNTVKLWHELDRATAAPMATITECAIMVRPVGVTLDVNFADAETLRRLFMARGTTAPHADSLSAALLDWRDADDTPRANGAEAAWYEAVHRATPPNAPIADTRDLSNIRGFERIDDFANLLGVDGGRLWLARAPLAVLAALPGFDSEVIARIDEQRRRGTPLIGIPELGALLSPGSRRRLSDAFTRLDAMATTTPDAWLVRARASPAASAVTVTIELRLTMAGERIGVARQRIWWGNA